MLLSFSCYWTLLEQLDQSNLCHRPSTSIILPISPITNYTQTGHQYHQSFCVEHIYRICLLVVLKVTLQNQCLLFSLINLHFFLFQALLCLRSLRSRYLLQFFHLDFRKATCCSQIICSMGKTTFLHTLSKQFQTLMIIVFYNKLIQIKTKVR